MNNPIWFKRKNYGWGWYPATWQGWLALVIFVSLMVLNAMRLNTGAPVLSMLLQFIPQTVVLVFLLLGLCQLTGEEPRWQWGRNSSL